MQRNKYLSEVSRYVKKLLEKLSEQATVEFEYDEKTANRIKILIRDSTTKVSFIQSIQFQKYDCTKIPGWNSLMEKLDLNDEIEFSYNKGQINFEVPGYLKNKIKQTILETNFMQPYIETIGYNEVFQDVDEESFIKEPDFYMFQVLPKSLDKIKFEKYNVGYYINH